MKKTKAAPSPVIAQLKALSASAFEELSFDLVQATGLRNAVWRTPGVDGGRDIEGDYPSADMAGGVHLQKWYIECKRYAASLDWPTLYPKLAYAINRRAQYLLLVTTAFVSPACKTEIAQHNSSTPAPLIRFWDATNLGTLLRQHPQLLVKYGLRAPDVQLLVAFHPLSLALARAAQAAYGAAEGEPSSALEFAAAASELLWARAKEAGRGVPVAWSPVDASVDFYPWLGAVNQELVAGLDRYAFRAVVSGFRYVTGASSLTLKAATGTEAVVHAEALLAKRPLTTYATDEVLGRVTSWSNFRVRRVDDTSLRLERHNG